MKRSVVRLPQSWARQLLSSVAVVAMLATGLLALHTTVAKLPEASAASTVGGSITRAEIIARAKYWYDRGDTWYSQDQSDAISDGTGGKYRPDCSGLVAMAWHLPKKSDGWDLNTGDFHSYSGKSWLGSLNDLLPGDALLKDGHIELFEKWVDPGDHGDGAWVYSENTYGQKTNHNIDSWSELTSYRGIRYDKISSGPTGSASIYGVLDDGRLTYTVVDVESADRTHGAVVSSASLGFVPVAMATLNFNTILVTSPAGQLYRVDVITNNDSLTFSQPTPLGGGWTHRLLAYDGFGHLYGIAGSALRRYTITAAKPAAANITDNTLIQDSGFTLKTLTATGRDWLLGTTSTGSLLSYKISGPENWARHELRASTWQTFDLMLSPGGGVYLGHKPDGSVTRYIDADPYDSNADDMNGAKAVDAGGWTQMLLS
ncbi:MAG: hypothetical protein ABIQ18_46120, partial [Umezawaea sp.]